MKLYNNTVEVRFNEGSHRYTISEDGTTWDYKPGVTSILGILSKPALLLWPMDEALKYLFGQKFEEFTQDDGSTVILPICDYSNALLQPDQQYTPLQLQSALKEARSAHTKKKDKGADTGKEVHYLIEMFLNLHKDGKTMSTITYTNKEVEKAFNAFVKWFNEVKPKVIATEQVVYSKTLGYCGTYDALLEIDGKRVLVDFKTSNASRTAPKGIYAENFIQLGGYALAYSEEKKEDLHDLLVVNVSKQGKVNTCYASELGLGVGQAIQLFRDTFSLFTSKNKLERSLK